MTMQTQQTRNKNGEREQGGKGQRDRKQQEKSRRRREGTGPPAGERERQGRPAGTGEARRRRRARRGTPPSGGKGRGTPPAGGHGRGSRPARKGAAPGERERHPPRRTGQARRPLFNLYSRPPLIHSLLPSSTLYSLLPYLQLKGVGIFRPTFIFTLLVHLSLLLYSYIHSSLLISSLYFHSSLHYFTSTLKVCSLLMKRR